MSSPFSTLISSRQSVNSTGPTNSHSIKTESWSNTNKSFAPWFINSTEQSKLKPIFKRNNITSLRCRSMHGRRVKGQGWKTYQCGHFWSHFPPPARVDWMLWQEEAEARACQLVSLQRAWSRLYLHWIQNNVMSYYRSIDFWGIKFNVTSILWEKGPFGTSYL